jgi:hypothetical protein
VCCSGGSTSPVRGGPTKRSERRLCRQARVSTTSHGCMTAGCTQTRVRQATGTPAERGERLRHPRKQLKRPARAARAASWTCPGLAHLNDHTHPGGTPGTRFSQGWEVLSERVRFVCLGVQFCDAALLPQPIALVHNDKRPGVEHHRCRAGRCARSALFPPRHHLSPPPRPPRLCADTPCPPLQRCTSGSAMRASLCLTRRLCRASLGKQ